MKIFFNKNNNGSEELQAHLGFIDAMVDYDNLERFVRNASREVQQLLGKPTYEALHVFYKKENPTETEKAYVDAVQDAVGIQAYRQYAPSQDVGHTINGRKMRLDEHEKMPFEWLIDKDNENMERMYYQALDHLLETLEDYATWTGSAEYKKVTALFVNSTAIFQEYFDINNSRLILLRLQPGLRQCEQFHILPRLTKSGFENLKDNAGDQAELLALVQEACVYWSLQWAFSGRLTVTLFPEGVLQRYVGDRNTTTAKQVASYNEYAWAAQNFKDDAERLFLRIEELLAPAAVDEDADNAPAIDFNQEDPFVST